MRGSGWLLPLAATALWLFAVGWPAAAAATALAADPPRPAATEYVPIEPPARLLAVTAAYALAVAAGAALLGWAPGRLLAHRVGRRGFLPLAVLLLFPLCLPAYVVYYAWWQAWPADSALHAWAVAHELVPLLKRATLVGGLLCWSWPLVAWCVAGGTAAGAREREEMLAVDGAGRLRRCADRLRRDAPGLGLGALLVFLITFNNTTCFDLAEIFTFGNELRAKDALGLGAGAVLFASAPAVGLAAAGAILLWLMLGSRARLTPRSAPPPAPGTVAVAAGVWLVSVVLPIALLLRGVFAWRQVREFVDLYGSGLARSLGLAGVAALLALPVAIGLFMAWTDHRRWVRVAAHAQAALWLIAALVPGTIVGVALEAAYNLPMVLWGSGQRADVTLADVFYRTPLILLLGYLARFGFVAALLGRWAMAGEPRGLADLRRVDGGAGLLGFLLAAGPRLAAVAGAAGALTLVLALGEVPVTARVHPPGSNPLVVSVLNDMHYQRPQTAMIATALLLVVALAAALVAVLGAAPRRARGRAVAVAAPILLLVLSGGCGAKDGAAPEPLDVNGAFGTNGTALGQFAYPRCLAIDPAREVVYVIDKTARVQRFGLDGIPQHQWHMPEKELGKPTGISVAPDGRVFVADTHYFRIIAYDHEGRELMRFGSYGEEPGQFIYPTDVAFGPEGRLYVSEYGGHDRIQVFSPEGEYLFEFGTFGSGEGQFDRPQSIAFNAEGTELYIADACNHRIVVTDPRGGTLRSFGAAGDGPGQFHYPYGITVLDDGSVLASEFGNNRLQLLSSVGVSHGRFGRLGSGVGELRYPWGVARTEDRLFVLDSGNDRVQMTDLP